jgi:hypothetical protein
MEDGPRLSGCCALHESMIPALGADGRGSCLPTTGTSGTGKPACSARYLGRVAPLGWGNLEAALLDPFEQGAGVAFDLVVAARNRDG